MTDINPTPFWANVRQLETNEYATGGLNGNMNEQAKSLAARSELLKQYAALPYESKTGGYALNERVQLTTGDIVRSTIASNVNNPNENMTGWVKTNDASQIIDESGRSQQQINDDFANINNYGAIGDGALHTVREWFESGKYTSLQHIQIKYPHVTSLDDSIDWAAIQKALNSGKKVTGRIGNYCLNKSLYWKHSNQDIGNIGTITMSAELGKPCLHVGASDENGTPEYDGGGALKLITGGKLGGVAFRGVGNRATGSCGINIVACTQMIIHPNAQGFYAGLGISGNKCYANTIKSPYLIKNTYGIIDLATGADLQGSVVEGGRIEQNQKEGVRTSSVNVKFENTVIEGNGLWDGGDGSTPEVTILGSAESGAIEFNGFYAESLNGKSAGGIIHIAPNAKRYVFVNGGQAFGGVANKNNIVVVDIKQPASPSVCVNMTGVYIADVKNYVRGVISGDSRVSIINCMPRDSLTVWTDVTVGTGLPLIQQFDREYWYSNQILKIKGIQATGAITTASTLTASDTATVRYTISTDANIGRTEFNNYLQSRQVVQTTPSASPLVFQSSVVPTGLNYLLEIKAVGRAGASNTHVFKASLVVENPSGTPIIKYQNINENTHTGQTLSFSVDESNNIVVTATAGEPLSGYLYRFFEMRYMQS